jgi:hypothetical protein
MTWTAIQEGVPHQGGGLEGRVCIHINSWYLWAVPGGLYEPRLVYVDFYTIVCYSVGMLMGLVMLLTILFLGFPAWSKRNLRSIVLSILGCAILLQLLMRVAIDYPAGLVFVAAFLYVSLAVYLVRGVIRILLTRVQKLV